MKLRSSCKDISTSKWFISPFYLEASEHPQKRSAYCLCFSEVPLIQQADIQIKNQSGIAILGPRNQWNNDFKSLKGISLPWKGNCKGVKLTIKFTKQIKATIF